MDSRVGNAALTWVSRAAIVVAFATLFAISVRAQYWVNADSSLYMHTGELILAGKVPYVDFVDLNPPLVMYLNVIPAWIAKVTRLPIVSVFNGLVAILTGIGGLALVRYLKLLSPRMAEPFRHLCAAVWIAFSFLVFTCGYWKNPLAAGGTDYGQREHLIALGYLPFLLLRQVRFAAPEARVRRAEAVAVGVLAGLMLALKPHYIAAALLVEVYFVVAYKRIRPLVEAETIAAASVGLVYALHFLFVPRAMRTEFFGRWLPLTASRYAAYNWSWDAVFAPETLHAVLPVFVIAWIPWREPYGAMMRRARPIAIFMLGAALALISQHKGWQYHLIVVSGTIYLTLVVIAAQAMAHVLRRSAMAVVAPLLIGLVSAWMGHIWSTTPMTKPYHSSTLDVVMKSTNEGDAIAYIGTGVQGSYPDLFFSNRVPGSRYLWTFPIAYLFADHTDKNPYKVPAGREDEERRLVSELVEDVHTRKPKLIFVWGGGSSQACPSGFNVATWLKQVGFEQKALHGYFESSRVSDWVVYARDDVKGLSHVREIPK